MLNQNFKDILSAFSGAKVEFMVVGAFAMAFYDYVRATGDLDLWIRPSEENSKKVWRALEKFSAPLFDLRIEDLQSSDLVFQIGVAPSRIDIITGIDGVDFDEAWKERNFVNVEGSNIPVINKAHLIINKNSTNRPKDKSDALWMESE